MMGGVGNKPYFIWNYTLFILIIEHCIHSFKVKKPRVKQYIDIIRMERLIAANVMSCDMIVSCSDFDCCLRKPHCMGTTCFTNF
jgi:hypothetical protein